MVADRVCVSIMRQRGFFPSSPSMMFSLLHSTDSPLKKYSYFFNYDGAH